VKGRLQVAGELRESFADFAGLFGQRVPHLFGTVGRRRTSSTVAAISERLLFRSCRKVASFFVQLADLLHAQGDGFGGLSHD